MVKEFHEQKLEKVWLCVSDAHIGLQAAIKKCWTGSVWQRCKVHFMRNIMATVPKKQKKSFGADLKKIWQAETFEQGSQKTQPCGRNLPKHRILLKINECQSD